MAAATGPQPTLRLNYDVLLNVMALCNNPRLAVPLMATCRYLYHHGAKVVLRKPLVLMTDKEAMLFPRFLRAEDLSRCRYLRHLEFSAFDLSLKAVEELLTVLPHLCNLTFLQLSCAEDIFESPTSLSATFASLNSLKHLHLTFADNHTCWTLAELQSQLVTVHVDFNDPTGESHWETLAAEDFPALHPIKLLERHAATLEELECVYWCTSFDPEDPPFQEVVPVYPNLRKFSFELHHHPIDVIPFIRAYPNLTYLHVSTDFHEGSLSDDIVEDMTLGHDTNVRRQLNGAGTWQHLQYYCGCLVDLYALGLTCHISRVYLQDCLKLAHLDMLAASLGYVRPAHLKIDGIAGSMLGDADCGVIAILRGVGGSNLLNLAVDIEFGGCDQKLDIKHIMDDLALSLSRLPLQCLDMRVDGYGLDPNITGEVEHRMARMYNHPAPNTPHPELPLCAAEQSMFSIDVDAYVRRLADDIPSLDDVMITMTQSRTSNRTATITRGKSRRATRDEWHDLRWTSSYPRFEFIQR